MNRRLALVVSSGPPEFDRDSGSRRIYDLIQLLRADGWMVVFVASQRLGPPRYRHALEQSGVLVINGTKASLTEVLQLAAFDVALFPFWSVAEGYLPVVRRHSPATRVIVDSVDLNFVRNSRRIFHEAAESGRIGVLDRNYGAEFLRELNTYAAADAVLTASAREAEWVNELIGGRSVATCVPDAESSPVSMRPLKERSGMLFVGSFRHQPNVGALRFLLDEVVPRLDASVLEAHPIRIVGEGLEEVLRQRARATPGVRVVGWVPSLAPYLERARLAIVPVRYGAGTKRKLLQALMSGTPAVSTRVGAEGFNLTPDEDVLIADDADGFAKAITRLTQDEGLWRRLAGNARRRVESIHGRDAVARRLATCLTDTLAAGPRALGQTTGAMASHPAARMDRDEYRSMCQRFRDFVHELVPSDAHVIVVSRGDEELVKLNGCTAEHFPQAPDGRYAGHHPEDSASAVDELERLRASGARYLLLPQSALWWLDHYSEFYRHLENHYREIARRSDVGLIYELSDRSPHPDTGGREPAPAAAPADFQRVDAGIAGSGRADRHDIVCFPIIDWTFRFQRPQQLMSRLAGMGHRVFYLAQEFREDGDPVLVRCIADNVYEVSLRGPKLNVYQSALDEASGDALFASLDALRRECSLRATVSVVQLPFWWPLAERATARFGWPVVYDCMDHHAGFSTNNSRMLEVEHELLCRADLVLASSLFLQREALQHNPNVLLLRNACDYPHFAQVPIRPPTRRPVIGYYGAIADWFDSDLVANLAERRPDWSFILVGSTFSADLRRLSLLSNVSLPGEQPYRDIPTWLARFDVTILPFKRVPLTEATNPVKAYEIFAAGKPLVSVPLPEMLAMAPHAKMASTPAEFEAAIVKELKSRGGDEARRRRDFARENTWQDRINSLTPAIRPTFGRAVIIIVSYQSPQLIRQCLESIWRQTDYPNYEVIVVDNASDAETTGYLRDAAGREPRLKVIFNDRNLGFARANNAGIEAAGDCDYLVLLNNDTVVTRGWLSTLIRHLQDPAVGMVGPVTNSCGNEAKIDVPYGDISGMEAFAAEYTRSHPGALFDIDVLAMYCVAFRSSLIAEIGGLDEQFGVGMFEDDDFSLRIQRSGRRVVCSEEVFIHHWGRASFGRIDRERYDAIFAENKRKFEAKWKQKWRPHQYRRPQTPAAAVPAMPG
jgi:GT2 family glycosyltransferase